MHDTGSSPRVYSSATVFEDQVFVVGGSLGGLFEDKLSDTWRSTDLGLSWRRGHRSALTL